MSQSLYTAMGGISAAQTDLEVISNNIANINTIGHKSSSVNFSEVYSTTISSGTGSTATTGGTNPKQVGLGVEVSSISKDFSSGTWIATGKTTDMMIQGSGFFSVQSSDGKIYYTRAGNFGFDSDGDLVTTDGYKVLGTDKLLAASSSTTAVHIPNSIVSEVTADADLAHTKVSQMNACTLTEGKFDITINDVTGQTASIDISFDANTNVSSLTSSMQSQIDSYLSANGIAGSITVTNTDGKISFNVDGTDIKTLKFSNPATGASNFISNSELNSTISGNSYSTKVLNWEVAVKQVTSIDSAISNPSYSIGDDGAIEATYSNGDTLSVQVGADGNSYEFVYTTAEGIVIQGTDANVDPNVAVPANFVIQLANITNPDGLLSAGSNLFSAGPNTGTIYYSVGDSMGLGAIASGGLEASNVDLSAEFSSMILAQRAVQANSRVFTTTSDIMDAIVSMGR